MTWADASARRLERHHLSAGARVGDPVAASAAVLGIHAQVRSAAELSIGIRADGLTRSDVRDASGRGSR
jgi:hypothetical protein